MNAREEFEKPLRVVQIVTAALGIGPLFFLAITFLIPQPPARTVVSGIPMLTVIGAVFTMTMLTARAIVLHVLLGNDLRQIANGQWSGGEPAERGFFERTGDAGRLFTIYRRNMIIGTAMLEGAAFLNLIAWLMERIPISLGIAILLIIGIFMQVPTFARLEAWIAKQYARVEAMRAPGQT